MNARTGLILTLVLTAAAIPLTAGGKKKLQPDRAMLEKMESVSCGAREKGLTGVGAVWASVGVTHVNSDEKLCQQYLVRTDDMEYVIRPTDKKHRDVLPVGHEIEYHIRKDQMFVKVPDNKQKIPPYQVVAMEPTSSAGEQQSGR